MVRRKVDTKAFGAETRVDISVGSAETTVVQASAPGQSSVRVMVPVTGEPVGPTERV